MRKYILIIVSILFYLSAVAQQDLYSWKLRGYSGVAHYYNSETNSNEYTKTDGNYLYRLELVKGLSNTFAISASSTFGKIKGVDFFNRTFTTKSRMASLRLYLYTDNGRLLNSSSFISPYFFGGFGLSIMETNSYGLYYESRNEPAIPFGAGLKFRIAERWSIDLQAEGVYNPDKGIRLLEITGNDDNIYLNAGISIAYSFGFRKSTFKAPRFYVGDDYITSDVYEKPRQNLVEAMLKIEPRDINRLKIAEQDSLHLMRQGLPKISFPDSLASDSLNAENDSATIRKMEVVQDTAEANVEEVILSDSLTNTFDSAIVVIPDTAWSELDKYMVIELNDTTVSPDSLDESIDIGVDSVLVKEQAVKISEQQNLHERKEIERKQRSKTVDEPGSERLPRQKVIERTVYVPTEISGGYIIGVKPERESEEKDTMGWQEVKAYFDSLTEVNNAYRNTIDSLQEQLSEGSTDDNYFNRGAYWQNSGSGNEFSEYIEKQESYHKSLQERFNRLENEIRKKDEEDKALELSAKNEAAIKAMNDSIAKLNLMLAGIPEKEVIKETYPLNTTVYFKSGSSRIPTESFVDLSRIARAVMNDTTLRVHLTGFADLSGDPQFNMQLSKRRAVAVSQNLQKNGVPQNRITIEYFGDKKAVKKSNPLIRKVEVKTIKR